MKKQGIIGSVSNPKDFNGKMQIGFTLKDDLKFWYNVSGEEDMLNELKKITLMKGGEIEFEYNEKKKEIGEITLLNKPKEEEKEKNWADNMTNFEDLLKAAHTQFKNRFEIKTELLRDGEGNLMLNLEKKVAVFKATIKVWDETTPGVFKIFEAHGDVTDENISGEKIKVHWIRMAETRAVVRALRFATNNAKVAEEETGGKK